MIETKVEILYEFLEREVNEFPVSYCLENVSPD